MGPEQGKDALASQLAGTQWTGTGVGNGIRSAKTEELIS